MKKKSKPKPDGLPPLIDFGQKEVIRHRCLVCQEPTGKEEQRTISKEADPLKEKTVADVTWGLCGDCASKAESGYTFIFCEGNDPRVAKFGPDLSKKLFKPEAIGQVLRVSVQEFDAMQEKLGMRKENT